MKKRIGSLLLSLALCLTLLPTAAFAQDAQEQNEDDVQVQSGSTHEHYLCGGDTCNEKGHAKESGKTTFTEWTNANSLPDTAGSYYLAADVTLNAIWKPTNGTVLCLNGHSITVNSDRRIIQVGENEDENATFTLCDCQNTGKITHKGNTNGRGVYVTAGCTFNMYGGSITGNKAIYSDDDGYGGGVWVSGTFNMSGGSITSNTATSGGGGVCMYEGSKFNMSGGEITGNNVDNSGNGGGVYVFAAGSGTPASMAVGGNATITGNKKGEEANNVYLPDDGSIITVKDDFKGKIGLALDETNKNKKLVSQKKGTITPDDPRYSLNDNGRAEDNSAPHEHAICASDSCEDHSTITFDKKLGQQADGKLYINDQEWTTTTNNNKYSLPAGNYYLASDLALEHKIYIANAAVNLCLNDNYIMGKADNDVIEVAESGTLNLTDCKGSGKITHETDKKGSGVYVNGGTFNMYGGKITGNAPNNNYGGGVYVTAGCTFNMYGGSITGNKAIYGDYGDYGGYGGGVYMNEESQFNMSGGEITNNNATYGGGGVYMGGGSQFNMSGGSITGNNVNHTGIGSGGGVYVEDSGAFKLYGGSITGNSAANGGGVCLTDASTFTVSGAPKITDNTANGTASNVYLKKGKTIALDGALTSGASIGVTLSDNYGDTPFTSGWTAKMGADENPAEYFHADKNVYTVSLVSGEVQLTAGGQAAHTHTYGTAWATDYGKHWHECTDASCPNKASSIKDQAEHVYDDAADATCNVCGKTRGVPRGTDFIITLDANGGTVTPASVKTANGVPQQVPTPIRSGYRFDGWFTAADGGRRIEDGSPVFDSMTFYAHWTYNGGGSSGGSSSGGGSSSSGSSSSGGSSSDSGSSTPVYTVSAPGKTDNGTVKLSAKSAKKGDTVTLTVTPDKGYLLETLTVLDKNGNEVKLTAKGDGKYTFTMPDGKVEVKAAFMDDNTMLNYFTDVKTGDYYYDAVLWAAKKSITSGVSDTDFGGERSCTRAQIVTFLWRAAGSPVVNDAMNMEDVPADAYYAEAVRWALSQGITGGTGKTTFSPDAVCTREQAVAFLYRASGSPAVQGGSSFTDVAGDAYYAAAVAWAAQNGVTGGIGNRLFGSGSACTRAQIVTFLYQAYQGK